MSAERLSAVPLPLDHELHRGVAQRFGSVPRHRADQAADGEGFVLMNEVTNRLFGSAVNFRAGRYLCGMDGLERLRDTVAGRRLQVDDQSVLLSSRRR
jgi:hypothetical protein